MLKRILSVILAATMVFSMAACGSDGSKKGDSIKVGMVTDTGGVNDGSFNESSWAGLQKAEKELGIEVAYLESKTDADYAANIETFMDEECDLIIGVGFMLADAVGKAAEANPDQKFAIIDDSTHADLPNVACLMFKQEQPSYLVGYVAGLMTETDNVGFVLGMSTGPMNQFGYGYCAGVLDANPDATIQMGDANSFGDSAQGKSLATAMITNGADVIFHAAGGTGLGMIEACKEADIWAIGVDSDQSHHAPENIITSALKRVDTASYEISKAVLEGTYKAGVVTYDLASEGVDYVASDLLPDDVKKAIDDVKAKILAGEIVVPNNQADFEADYGDVYTLD
ncbi:MAG: BMP family ABC transporter substrate-binding protein [Lachnospiraceae bacterium]|nr:BMP family ABC transporter substrate-binding protein [Lachnospiraceae bacterium]